MTHELWSTLSSLPVTVYMSKYNAHVCYWNSVITTRTYAVMIAMHRSTGMYYTEIQKELAWKEYLRYYRCGVFLNKNWDKLLETSDHHHHYAKTMTWLNRDDFLSETCKNYSSQEIIKWFSSNREIIDNTLYERKI